MVTHFLWWQKQFFGLDLDKEKGHEAIVDVFYRPFFVIDVVCSDLAIMERVYLLAAAVFVGVALIVLDKRVSIQNALMIAMMLSCKTRITGALFSLSYKYILTITFPKRQIHPVSAISVHILTF